MEIKLSERLSAAVKMIDPGMIAADIGTDHGYLPAYLILSGISPSAIASDVNEHPLASAANLIGLLAIEKKVHLRLGDGLSVLMPGEADVLVIAGMGASTMTKILESAPQVLEKARRLILQPMRDTSKIRLWLADHGWQILDEELVYEDNIFYEIIAAEHGLGTLSPEEAENGPVLLKRKHPLLKKFVLEKIQTLEDISNCLEKGIGLKAEDQRRNIREKIEKLKRVRACL